MSLARLSRQKSTMCHPSEPNHSRQGYKTASGAHVSCCLPPYLHRGMCYWRQVRNLYIQCGHAVNLVDEEIKCDLVRCRFSPVHPKNCAGQACIRTCWQ
ncbi:hypothetical protein DFH07DRAFT_858037 [Mycena maculata]|uniref:Uncharacterized protein n=1 Tax=Mycena maculata TaxID=230809 RepID=A0AAD7ML06_9AGAR|nr:hypothetical protein DFH07DRAFT_858037 [Mycena maculata]